MLLNRLASSSAAIKLSVDNGENAVFLGRRTAVIERDDPPFDAQLCGKAHIFVKKRTAVDQVKVVLTGRQTYGEKGSTRLLSTRETTIKILCAILDVGTYELAWTIVVPNDAETSQSGRFGKIQHHVQATLSGPSSSIESVPVEVKLIATSEEGIYDRPAPVSALLAGDNPFLGPMRICVSGANFSVGELLRVDTTFLAPLAATKVLGLELFFDQTSSVREEDGSSSKMPKESFFSKEVTPSGEPRSLALPLTVLAPGRETRFTQLFRCPPERLMSASTFAGSADGIRVSHKIHARVRYVLGSEAQVRNVTFTRPCFIASCLISSLQHDLPAYTKHDVLVKAEKRSCACSQSVQELYASNAELFERAIDVQEEQVHSFRAKTPAHQFVALM